LQPRGAGMLRAFSSSGPSAEKAGRALSTG